MTLRDEFNTEQRVLEPYHHIDPGFINWRLCFSTFGTPLVEAFEKYKYGGSDHPARIQNDHVIVDLVLQACKPSGVTSLGEALSKGKVGLVWSSTEELEGNERVYHDPRIRDRIFPMADIRCGIRKTVS